VYYNIGKYLGNLRKVIESHGILRVQKSRNLVEEILLT